MSSNHLASIKPVLLYPGDTAERDLIAFENEFFQMQATLTRIRRSVDALAAERDRLAAERDRQRYWSEDEAAAELKLHDGKSLATLRRRHNLPHLKIGGTVVYTREHFAAIERVFEIEGRRRLKRAA